VLTSGITYARIMLVWNVVILSSVLINAVFRGSGRNAANRHRAVARYSIKHRARPCLILGLGPFRGSGSRERPSRLTNRSLDGSCCISCTVCGGVDGRVAIAASRLTPLKPAVMRTCCGSRARAHPGP